MQFRSIPSERMGPYAQLCNNALHSKVFRETIHLYAVSPVVLPTPIAAGDHRAFESYIRGAHLLVVLGALAAIRFRSSRRIFGFLSSERFERHLHTVL